jgi:flavin reductase (DIM6/NTAB) family NADH-FMN oxidoreductase RutF
MSIEQLADPTHLRRVYGAFPTGVVALAALVGDRPVGLAASSFTSVSLDPPLVSVSIAHTSTTWRLLRAAPRFGLSVLSSRQEQACRQLAARAEDRFSGLAWRATDDGAVLLAEAGAWLECSIDTQVPAGDHDLILLRVHNIDIGPESAPLVFHASRFRRLEP